MAKRNMNPQKPHTKQDANIRNKTLMRLRWAILEEMAKSEAKAALVSTDLVGRLPCKCAIPVYRRRIEGRFKEAYEIIKKTQFCRCLWQGLPAGDPV